MDLTLCTRGDVASFMPARLAVALLALACTYPACAQVNLLVNGSFEQGPDPGEYRTYQLGSTDIPGWTVTRASIDHNGTHFPASDGTRTIDLDGTPGFGGIKQTFATVLGQTYDVTFDLAGNPQGPPAIKEMGVDAAGQSAVFSHGADLNWTRVGWTFTAREQNTTIEFYSLDTEGGSWGPLLDNVAVTASPARTVPRKIAAGSVFGANLISNGDAEMGLGSVSGNDVVPVAGWTRTGQFTVLQYGAQSAAGSFPKPDDPGPSDRGRNFFAGGPVPADSGATQSIDVSAEAASIDRGEVVFRLAGYLGGYIGQNDRAALVASFRGENGSVLGRATIGPVTAENRQFRTGLWPRSASGGLPQGTRTIDFGLNMAYSEGGYNDGYADNLSFRLDRPGLLERLFARTRISIDPDRPSALPNQAINIQVGLVDSGDVGVVAERDVPVDLEAKGAEVRPAQVTISRGSSSASAQVVSSQPGRFEVRASSPGLDEARTTSIFCADGAAQGFNFDTPQQRAYAGTTKIPFTVVLIDGQGRAVSDAATRSIALNLGGVGRLESSDGLVPPGQCAKTNKVSSDDAGVAKVKATFNQKSDEKDFLFTLRPSIGLFLLVFAGGMAGAFIRAVFNWRSSRRWAPIRWLAILSCGGLIGLCVFFAYEQGLLALAPNLAGGERIGFLLGMIGGYLGQSVMDRIAGQVLPSAKAAQH